MGIVEIIIENCVKLDINIEPISFYYDACDKDAIIRPVGRTISQGDMCNIVHDKKKYSVKIYPIYLVFSDTVLV